MINISQQTARRFVLGCQGLYPGRRFVEQNGTASAIRQSEAIQIDTINIIARSHDIALHSRVEGYRPEMLETLCYQERRFFDYGGILFVYSMEEMPYFQTVMQCHAELLVQNQNNLPTVQNYVLEQIRDKGAMAGRDFSDKTRVQGGFNTMKVTGIALYQLWRSGKLGTHSRRNFDRVYDLFERIVGRPVEEGAASPEDAERYFARKSLRDCGLATPSEWGRRAKVTMWRLMERLGTTNTHRRMEQLVAEGEAIQVKIEGLKDVRYAPSSAVGLLETLDSGAIPKEWHSNNNTEEEVTFIAPLDNVIWDRARTRAIFGFDYLWEVYKPATQRQWGYYTLPILWRDQFVARAAFKLDRKNKILHIEGFWLEDDALKQNPQFQFALEQGLQRFAAFHEAKITPVIL